MRKNNCPFQNKNRGNYSQRNAGSYAARRNTGNSKPRYNPTTVLYLPNVLYSWGLKIAENLGPGMIESYRNRIPATITDLNSEDKDFWKWARAKNIPVVEVGNLVDAQTLMRDGVAGVVSTTLDQFPIATKGGRNG